MAGDPIAELVNQLYGGGAQKEIAASNPYNEISAVPDSIGNLITGLAAKPDNNYDLSSLLTASLVSGLVGGGLNTLKDNYNTDKTKEYQKAVETLIKGGDTSGSTLSPKLLSNAQNTVNTFKLTQGLQDAEDKRKLGLTIDAEVDKAKRLAKPAASYTPEQLQVLGLSDGATPEQVDLALKLKDADLKLKEADLKKVPKRPEFPAAMIQNLAEQKGVIDEASAVGSTLKNSNKSWGDLQSAQIFSGLDKDGIAQRISNLADRVLRTRSGAAASAAETAKLRKIIAGDSTVTPQEAGELLTKFAESERRNAVSQINLATDLQSQDPLSSFNSVSQPAQPTPPPGYELTGKVDASGNYGIRKIR